MCESTLLTLRNRNTSSILKAYVDVRISLDINQAYLNMHITFGEIVKSTSFAKLIKDDDYEITLFKDGRMNVYGIEDDEEAFKLYHSYLKALK